MLMLNGLNALPPATRDVDNMTYRAICAPRNALKNLKGALVLTFRWETESRTFLLVADYPFNSPGVPEFVAFVFEGAQFERLPPEWPIRDRYHRFHDSYQ